VNISDAGLPSILLVRVAYIYTDLTLPVSAGTGPAIPVRYLIARTASAFVMVDIWVGRVATVKCRDFHVEISFVEWVVEWP